MPMSLFYIIAVVIIAGVCLWALNAFPAIDPTMKQIARVLIILFVVILVLYFLFSMVGGGMGLHGMAGPCR
jgi:hypothetical protein